MSRATRPSRPLPDQVDRAVATIRRGIGQLVGLLGDEDWTTIEKVATALAEIGPFCVGPLASALPRARTPRHRAAIIGVLLTFGSRARAPVLRALTAVLKNERDPGVRAGAELAFTKLVADEIAETAASVPGWRRAGRDLIAGQAVFSVGVLPAGVRVEVSGRSGLSS